CRSDRVCGLAVCGGVAFSGRIENIIGRVVGSAPANAATAPGGAYAHSQGNFRTNRAHAASVCTGLPPDSTFCTEKCGVSRGVRSRGSIRRPRTTKFLRAAQCDLKDGHPSVADLVTYALARERGLHSAQM